MNEIKIHQVDSGTGARVLRLSWELVKANYASSLGFSLFLLLAGMFAQIPNIGFVAQSLVGNLALIIFCFVAHQWNQGQTITLSQALMPLTHDQLMKRLVPLFIVSIVVAAIWNFLSQSNPLVLLIFYFAYFFVTLCISLCFPLMIFNPKVALPEAVDLVIQGVFQNLGAYLLGAFLSTLLMLACALVFFVPLFFVYIPINIAYNYLWYRCIFEGDPLGQRPSIANPPPS